MRDWLKILFLLHQIAATIGVLLGLMTVYLLATFNSVTRLFSWLASFLE